LWAKDSILGAGWASVKSTWDPSGCFTVDHILFAFRNWLAIFICFLIGYYASGTFFDRYSYVMASTLSFLILKDGSRIVEYERSTKRLLGVTLGKCLPIMAASLLTSFPCVSLPRLLAQGFTIWAFATVFLFVKFNSDVWSYPAGLIAGFGIASLMEPCVNLDDDLVFADKYKELGSVTVAIFIQAILQAILHRRSARQVLADEVRKLTHCLVEGVGAVFSPDIAQMEKAVKEAAAQMKAAKEVAVECDPKMQLCRGASQPFDVAFCRTCLMHMEIVLAELNLIIAAAKDWVPCVSEDSSDEGNSQDTPAGILELMHSRGSLDKIRHQLLESFQLVVEVLPEMLEGTFDRKRLVSVHLAEKARAAKELEGAEALYHECAAATQDLPTDTKELTNDPRVRFTIVVRALQNTARHLGNIEEACIKHSNK